MKRTWNILFAVPPRGAGVLGQVHAASQAVAHRRLQQAGQGAVQEPVGPALGGKKCQGVTHAAFGGMAGQVLPPGQLLWAPVLERQAAGFRTFLFPPTRCFVSAPFSVTLLSHLRGNPELLVEG